MPSPPEKANQAQAPTPQKTLLFLGDSLTAGYGVSREEAFPFVLQQLLEERLSQSVEVINGGQSGALSSNAIENLNFYLGRIQPDLIVLTTGGNDARQGAPTAVIRENIAKAVRRAQEDNRKVLLGGMQIFPNLGQDYSEAFRQIYPDLAQEFSVPLIPFLLEGVAGEPEYNQYDGFHPNEKGHRKIAEHILPFIVEALK